MPEAAYFIPTVYGDLTGLNQWVWNLSHLLADQKFMTIFSILFGAGVVLMTRKIEARGESSRGIHYRRNFWLLLIGMAHAYLIWSGDILVAYALCAFLIYFLRNMPPRRQLIIGLIWFAIAPLLMYLSTASLQFAPPETRAEITTDLVADWQPSQEEIEAELAAYRGGFMEQMEARVPSSIAMQTISFFFWALWRAGGLMIIGMALYKWGVLSAERSARFYIWLMIAGFGIGLPIVAYGITQQFGLYRYDYVDGTKRDLPSVPKPIGLSRSHGADQLSAPEHFGNSYFLWAWSRTTWKRRANGSDIDRLCNLGVTAYYFTDLAPQLYLWTG